MEEKSLSRDVEGPQSFRGGHYDEKKRQGQVHLVRTICSKFSSLSFTSGNFFFSLKGEGGLEKNRINPGEFSGRRALWRKYKLRASRFPETL